MTPHNCGGGAEYFCNTCSTAKAWHSAAKTDGVLPMRRWRCVWGGGWSTCISTSPIALCWNCGRRGLPWTGRSIDKYYFNLCRYNEGGGWSWIKNSDTYWAFSVQDVPTFAGMTGGTGYFFEKGRCNWIITRITQLIVVIVSKLLY